MYCKTFQVGNIKVIMEHGSLSNNHGYPLEIHLHNLSNRKYTFLYFTEGGNFKAMGERMVKQAVRELK